MYYTNTKAMKKNKMWMLAAVVASCLVSCTNKDNPVEPSQQKMLSHVSTYLREGNDLKMDKEHLCTYDAQGRLVEWKSLTYSNGTALDYRKIAFTYSAGRIRTVETHYAFTPGSKTVIADADFDLDDQGRIEKMSLYSYTEGKTREDAKEAFITEYTYDEQGRLTHRYNADVTANFEWQGTELVKDERLVDNHVMSVRLYEPSDIPAGHGLLPIGKNDSEDWLMALGYFGQPSQFLPAKQKQEAYGSGMLMSTTEYQYAYELTDGVVTACEETVDNEMIFLNMSAHVNYRHEMEWK